MIPTKGFGNIFVSIGNPYFLASRIAVVSCDERQTYANIRKYCKKVLPVNNELMINKMEEETKEKSSND